MCLKSPLIENIELFTSILETVHSVWIAVFHQSLQNFRKECNRLLLIVFYWSTTVVASTTRFGSAELGWLWLGMMGYPNRKYFEQSSLGEKSSHGYETFERYSRWWQYSTWYRRNDVWVACWRYLGLWKAFYKQLRQAPETATVRNEPLQHVTDYLVEEGVQSRWTLLEQFKFKHIDLHEDLWTI